MAFGKQPVGITADDRQHRLPQRACLPPVELPCAERRQIAAEEVVGVVHRSSNAAGYVPLDVRAAAVPLEAANHAQKLRHRPFPVTRPVRVERRSDAFEKRWCTRHRHQRWLEQRQGLHPRRIVEGHLQGNGRPRRVTGHVSAPDAQVVEQGDTIGRVLREAHACSGRPAGVDAPLVISDQAEAVRQRLLRDEGKEAVRDGTGTDEEHRVSRSGDGILQLGSVDAHLVHDCSSGRNCGLGDDCGAPARPVGRRLSDP